MALPVRCNKGHSYMQADVYPLNWPEGAPRCPECLEVWMAKNKIEELPEWDFGEDFQPIVEGAKGSVTAERLVRTMATALAEVCLHAYIVDRWIQHCVDPECVADLVDGGIYQSQPWYELSEALPVSREALVAIISGPAPRNWDVDVAALAEYITAAVMRMADEKD